jgi:hypothetical protein
VPEQSPHQQDDQQDEQQREQEPEGEESPPVVDVTPLVVSSRSEISVGARVQPGLKGPEPHEQRHQQHDQEHQDPIPTSHECLL